MRRRRWASADARSVLSLLVFFACSTRSCCGETESHPFDSIPLHRSVNFQRTLSGAASVCPPLMLPQKFAANEHCRLGYPGNGALSLLSAVRLRRWQSAAVDTLRRGGEFGLGSVERLRGGSSIGVETGVGVTVVDARGPSCMVVIDRRVPFRRDFSPQL